jgi:hypothetical protein
MLAVEDFGHRIAGHSQGVGQILDGNGVFYRSNHLVFYTKIVHIAQNKNMRVEKLVNIVCITKWIMSNKKA